MTDSTAKGAFGKATAIGTVLQLGMVIAGHWVPWIKENGFAIGGVLISALAGALYARRSGRDRMGSAQGGLLAGGISALLGILVSFALGDVPALILAVGTASSAGAGGIAGAIFSPGASRK